MVLVRALRVRLVASLVVAFVAMSARAAEEPEVQKDPDVRGPQQAPIATPPPVPVAPPPDGGQPNDTQVAPPVPGGTATPPGIDATVGEKAQTLRSIEITGTLRESQERLLRFLSLAPGVVFDVELRDRTRALLRQLGYRLVEIGVDDGKLHIKLALIRNVWWVRVKGNFPYFDDEILRHLSLRTGSEVEDEDNLEAKLAEEAKTIERFLERDGYFGSKVEIEPKRIGDDRVDLLVRVRLGTWFRLGSVDVRGSSMLRPGELFDAFDHCCFALGRFRPSSLRNDARTAEKKLRDRGYPGARVEPDFSLTRDVDVQAGKVRLPVEVSEKRKVEVVLIGNRSLQTRELRSELTLFSGVGYSRRDVEENAELLQRAAQRRGFFEAKVDYKITRRADNSDLVEFFIQEGVELRVRSVDFVTQDLSELPVAAELLKREAALETKVFPRLGVVGLGEGGYVTTVQLQQDEERLVEYFRLRGYPEIKVRGEVARSEATFGALGALGAESATQQTGNNIYVRFFLDLGRHEMVEGVNIDFKGEHRKQAAEVRKMIVDTVPGKAFTEGALAADQVRILDLYKSSGRPYVEISPPKLEWNETHDRVRITLTIAEGNDVRFGEILVRGNFRTRERVILKDLPFRRGDNFDLRKIEEGERNLQNHLIFNSVKVLPVALDGKPGEVAILVQVQERYLERFGSAAAFVGVQTDRLPYYYYVGATYQWNNFAGYGSQLEVRADFSWTNSFGVSARYSDLYAFGPGWRFDLTLFYRREVTRRLGPIEAFGGSIGITRAITRSLRAFTRIDLIRSQLSVTFLRLNGPADTATLQDNTTTGKLVLGIMWDRRTDLEGVPNPLMPQKGWLLSATTAYAPPIFGNHFFALSAQAMGLLPIKLRDQTFTLIGNLRYDHGFPIGQPALPAVERFFAGGDTTTRGYGTDQLKTEIIAAEVPPLGDGSGFRIIPQGGNVRFLSTIEFQFPIAKTFLGLPVQWVGSVFWDVGAIMSDVRLVQQSDFKHGVGISLLRLLTPFGPLSLEYAYPLNQSLAEQTWKTAPWYAHFPGRIHFNWQIPLGRF